MTGIFTMTNTNTVNIHFFLHITSGVNQNQHYCAILWAYGKSITMFMTAGPGNPLLLLEGCQKMQKELWTKKKAWNVAEWNEVSSWMYVERKRKFFKSGTDGGYKMKWLCVWATAGVCVCVCALYVCICVIKKDSVLYRGINYCVIGLSQPRYVMLNLVAKSTREKREKKKYKLLWNVQYIWKYEYITQPLVL